MSAHPYAEGDRVQVDHKTWDGPHVETETRVGTVAQVSSTQPHITWVDWDNGPSWQMIGTSHLRRVRTRCCGIIREHGALSRVQPCHDCPERVR